MPKNKFESVVFTAMTAWIIVYIMTLYNTALAAQSFTNVSFALALGEMWAELALIFLCAFFLSSPAAKRLASRVAQPGDRPIAVILTVQVFTVLLQVALASILGVYHGYGFTGRFVPHYLLTCCKNFVTAPPVQLFVAGPAARWLFRTVFARKEKASSAR